MGEKWKVTMAGRVLPSATTSTSVTWVFSVAGMSTETVTCTALPSSFVAGTSSFTRPEIGFLPRVNCLINWSTALWSARAMLDRPSIAMPSAPMQADSFWRRVKYSATPFPKQRTIWS